MSEIGQNLKNIVMKGIDLIGTKASELASGAKQKVDAFNLENEKKDLLAELGKKVYEMSREGIELPEALQPAIDAVLKIEEELKTLTDSKPEEAAPASDENAVEEKADEEEKASGEPVYDDVPAEQGSAPEAPVAAEAAAQDDNDVPVLRVEEDPEEEQAESCPLSSAINDLFENIPPVDKMVDKVNASLDELGENLQKFSGDFGKQLEDFTDRMMGKNDSDPKE